MTERAHGDHHRTTYECMDVNAEGIPGSGDNDDGALFFFTETACNGIDCPPYAEGHELTCVWCTTGDRIK